MARKKTDDGPGLFDDFDEVPSVATTPDAAERTPGMWQEVPQARFLSWSWAMQLAYCAARDAAHVEETDDPAEAAWLLQRAESYMEMMHESDQRETHSDGRG